MNKATDILYSDNGFACVGIRFYPYQLGLGISVSMWPLFMRPEVSLHIGPLKVWAGISGEQIISTIKRVTRWTF